MLYETLNIYCYQINSNSKWTFLQRTH